MFREVVGRFMTDFVNVWTPSFVVAGGCGADQNRCEVWRSTSLESQSETIVWAVKDFWVWTDQEKYRWSEFSIFLHNIKIMHNLIEADNIWKLNCQ